MTQNKLTFTKEQAKQIQEYNLKDFEFKKNMLLIVTAWQLQKISTSNAVRLVNEELKKAEKRN